MNVTASKSTLYYYIIVIIFVVRSGVGPSVGYVICCDLLCCVRDSCFMDSPTASHLFLLSICRTKKYHVSPAMAVHFFVHVKLVNMCMYDMYNYYFFLLYAPKCLAYAEYASFGRYCRIQPFTTLLL